jgi:hypothetical protein
VTACATPYGHEDRSGNGFHETEIKPETFRVVFHGNIFTTGKEAERAALRRCAEIAFAEGYRYFEVEATTTRYEPVRLEIQDADRKGYPLNQIPAGSVAKDSARRVPLLPFEVDVAIVVHLLNEAPVERSKSVFDVTEMMNLSHSE